MSVLDGADRGGIVETAGDVNVLVGESCLNNVDEARVRDVGRRDGGIGSESVLLADVGDLGRSDFEGDDNEDGAEDGQSGVSGKSGDKDHASDDIKCGIDADRVHFDVAVVVAHVGSVDNAAVDNVRRRGRLDKKSHDVD